MHCERFPIRWHRFHVFFDLNPALKTSNALLFLTITIENTWSNSTRLADKTKSVSFWQVTSAFMDTPLLTLEMLIESSIWPEKSLNSSTLLESPDNKKPQYIYTKTRDTVSMMEIHSSLKKSKAWLKSTDWSSRSKLKLLEVSRLETPPNFPPTKMEVWLWKLKSQPKWNSMTLKKVWDIHTHQTQWKCQLPAGKSSVFPNNYIWF